MNDNVIDLSLYRNDVIYTDCEGKICAVAIDNIKIEFIDDSVTIEVLDEIQDLSKGEFVNLLVAYLALERPDLLKFDD